MIALGGHRARRWRNIATSATAIAAALVAMIAVGAYRPELLPDQFRTQPRTQVVQAKVSAGPRRHRPSMSPCCKRMAGRRRSFSRLTGRPGISRFARSAATAEPGKSFELWLISDKLQRPRSLGVIGAGDFTTRPVLASYDADTIKAATFAVTVEQPGGSPDGKPTSAPVYAGKLIESVAGGFAQALKLLGR